MAERTSQNNSALLNEGLRSQDYMRSLRYPNCFITLTHSYLQIPPGVVSSCKEIYKMTRAWYLYPFVYTTVRLARNGTKRGRGNAPQARTVYYSTRRKEESSISPLHVMLGGCDPKSRVCMGAKRIMCWYAWNQPPTKRRTPKKYNKKRKHPIALGLVHCW